MTDKRSLRRLGYTIANLTYGRTSLFQFFVSHSGIGLIAGAVFIFCCAILITDQEDALEFLHVNIFDPHAPKELSSYYLNN